MARLALLDLHLSATILGVPRKLVNRRDSAVDGVSARDGKARRIKGVIGRAADAGYFLGLLEGEVVLTADGAIINAFTQMIPLDIPVPGGNVLSFYYVNTAGTAAAMLTVLVEEPDA